MVNCRFDYSFLNKNCRVLLVFIFKYYLRNLIMISELKINYFLTRGISVDFQIKKTHILTNKQKKIAKNFNTNKERWL